MITGRIRVEEHVDAHGAERVEVTREGGVAGEGVLDERDGDRRYAEAGQFAQQGHGEVVGDAGCPLVDRVEGCPGRPRRRLPVAEPSARWACGRRCGQGRR